MRWAWLLLLVGCGPTAKIDTGTAPVPPWETDDDGDDYTADEDCDDADASIHPGAPEVCDGLDQDCDDAVDEDAVDAPSWHPDADGDGAYSEFGTPACDPIPGAAESGDDCDDTDAAVFPGATEVCNGGDDDCDGQADEGELGDAPTWYADADADGFGDPATGTVSCAPPADTVADGTDCDDLEPATFPGAVETCDGLDNDCDGLADDAPEGASTWYADTDADGFGDGTTAQVACAAPAGTTADGTDCDDTDATISPGAPETCDGRDDDCDGTTDESDAVDATTWYVDDDADGYGTDGATARSCRAPLGYADVGGDCDDLDPTLSPAAAETCDEVDQDCDGTVDEGALDARTWYADADGDGFGDPAATVATCEMPAGYGEDATDCDDGDAATSPAADEHCDGADDDCDGTVDEDDAVDAPTWYADTDGDGFGDLAALMRACTLPTGYLADATDCDDADGDTFPGADEYCDRADDDCDGTVDEDDAVDAPTWYADADGDLYGDAALASVACAAPTGTVADATDCDDADGIVNPGRVEACNDGLDNDCDGTDGSCTQVGDQDMGTIYHARVIGRTSSNYVGSSVAHVGDVDQDGLADLVVGAQRLDEVWLLYGVPFGDLDIDDVPAAFVGTGGDLWGIAVAGVGDTDGDGYADVLIGAPEVGAAVGAALLLPGNWDPIETETDATLTLEGETRSDQAGTAVAGGGDLDGDGLNDLVVGAPQADGTYTAAGIAYIVYGGATGTLDLGAADGRLLGGSTWSGMGASLAGVGDVDGDGLDDLLVGADTDGTAAVLAGAAYLVLGPAAGDRAATSADAIFLGESTYDLAGTSVACAGDTDGDGDVELLVGAKYHDGGGINAGAAYLLRGPFSGSSSLATAAVEVQGEDTSDYAGFAVSGAGDFNADGFDDWMVGAWGADALAGTTYLYYGPGPWGADLADADLRLHGALQANLGYALSGGAGPWGSGDLTDDGIDDLLLGAPVDPESGSNSGAGYVVAGRGL